MNHPKNSSRPFEAAAFDWPLAEDAERLLRERIEMFLERNSCARGLASRMRDETATDLFEWIDHLVLSAEVEPALIECGFVRDATVETPEAETVYEHPKATLPRVLILNQTDSSVIALRPERLEDFVAHNALASQPEGDEGSRYRRVLVAAEQGTSLEAVERRAYRGFLPAPLKQGEAAGLAKAREIWRTRPRRFADDVAGIEAANQALERVLDLVGRDVACQLFFEAEREYWERRNRAAQFQKQRQDRLGLGWGNHDHHTFRCSRRHFVDVISFLRKLGFELRERYYAGNEAGWGAQICEHPVTGVVVFADVDLMPDEKQIDFSTTRLHMVPRLGTVGLWVGLHGESFLEAGMHHLEARFEFNLLREQLKTGGINMMEPFSNFEFLRQAFTQGERWPVRAERAQRLLSTGQITPEQCQQFVETGAIGSHLENLQRHGGFKGFNQRSVSAIIAATDPRQQREAAASSA